MKAKLSGIMILKGLVAAVIVAAVPQLVQASESQSKTVTSSSTTTTETAEVASLKRQLADCNQRKMHRRHHLRACIKPKQTAQVIEKTTVIEKPVVIEKVIEKTVYVDKPVEKTVYVDRPVEKQVVLEQAAECEKAVVVEHSKHRKHLLHIGIPFIGVTLF